MYENIVHSSAFICGVYGFESLFFLIREKIQDILLDEIAKSPFELLGHETLERILHAYNITHTLIPTAPHTTARSARFPHPLDGASYGRTPV